MRVDRNGRLAERHVEHDVRGLAPDAGQRLQRRALSRHLAAILRDQPSQSSTTFFALLR